MGGGGVVHSLVRFCPPCIEMRRRENTRVPGAGGTSKVGREEFCILLRREKEEGKRKLISNFWQMTCRPSPPFCVKRSKLKTDFKSLGDDCLLLSRKKKTAHRTTLEEGKKSLALNLARPFPFPFQSVVRTPCLPMKRREREMIYFGDLWGSLAANFGLCRGGEGEGREGSFSLSSFRSNFQDKEEEGRHKSGGSRGRGRKGRRGLFMRKQNHE